MSWLILADGSELKKGTEAEKEHAETIKWIISKLGGDPGNEKLIEEVAKRIAQDHLKELPDYYTRLEGMEKSGEQQGGK